MSGVPGIKELQETLADEHAAVYLFGLMGARVSERTNADLLGLVTDSFSKHRDNRDALSALINQLGEVPVAAAVAYQPPGPINTPAQIQRVAAKLEQQMTLRYGSLIAATSGKQRTWAISALQQSAVREIDYGLQPRDLPGL
ncbi:MAG TPA: ferritin-like domain-containing protein [Marmoricola sp.]|nr:ferritin-like domain-containing protein [Marmoricola sp.]HNO40342.1 ferritin-like domain-containing protein [Marmoricola sp.]